jgi:hypothetical protein
MGQHADDAIDRACSEEEKLYDYLSGGMSTQEAMERGVLNEDGILPLDAPNRYGVHDVESLEHELIRLDYEMAKAVAHKLNKKPPEPRWVSADGKVHAPRTMTTSHLENSIRFAKRNGIDNQQIVQDMRNELQRRINDK